MNKRNIPECVPVRQNKDPNDYRFNISPVERELFDKMNQATRDMKKLKGNK